MKQILIEIDDRCARDLERVAPAKRRTRAEFIRLAIRRAIDAALDRDTDLAYRKQPLDAEWGAGDLLGWDAHNRLATPERAGKGPRRRKRKRAA